MNYRILAIGSIAILSGLPQQARTETNECLSTLVKNVNTVLDTTATSYALIELIKRNLTTSEQKNIGGKFSSGGIDIGLNSADAQKASSDFLKQTKVNWDQKTMVNIVSQTLSDNAVEAYKTCTLGQQTVGPRVIAYDATPTQVNIKVKWVSAYDAPVIAPAKFDVTGSSTKILPPKPWKNQEERVYLLDRIKGQDLIFNATIGGKVDKIYIPYIPNVVVSRKVFAGLLYPASPVTLNKDYRASNVGPLQDCVSASPGREIVPGSARLKVDRSGHIDDTTYVKITEQDESRVCYSAYFRPLSRENPAHLYFQVIRDEVLQTYNLTN